MGKRIGWYWGTKIGRVMRLRRVETRFYGVALGSWALGVWRG